jgi:Rrf2 family protein
MKLQRDVEYGLMGLIDLERLDEPVSARALAERLSVPGELLSKVLQRLQRAGLVAAVRGARGGYRLRRPLSEISLREVIEASHGPLAVVDCLKPGACPQETHCTIRPQAHGLQGLLDGFLGSLSVRQFADRQFAEQVGGGA